jgi:hypothetical protein
MVDLSQCAGMKVSQGTDPAALKAGRAQKCADPPVLGTITWSELGLTGASDLRHEQMLVSTDGTHWDTTTAPATSYVRDLVATNDGFLLLTENTTDPGSAAKPASPTTLLHSTDARNWTPVATPAGLDVQTIAGDQVLGVDAAGVIQTSSDGGTTWQATSIASKLPAGAPAPQVTASDAGPLGFAVLVTADAKPNDNTPGPEYLLFSTDGNSWSTTDLATVGEPAGSYPAQLTVGADHVSIDYQAPPVANGRPVMTTLLATPKR